MTSYPVYPYVGVGPLEFGMSPDQAGEQIGAADEVSQDLSDGTLTEFRLSSALQLTYELSSQKLVGISLHHPLDGIAVDSLELDWNESEQWLAELKRRDPTHGRSYGIDVFFKFGVSASGLQHRENGDKSVSAFAMGQWDPSSPDLIPRK